MAIPASNASRAAEPGGSQAPAAGSNTRPTVDVTAVTTRDDFLLELGETLAGHASVRPVDSVAAALEHLTSTKRAQLLVIDARDVADVRADVERAHAQAAHAAVLVFAAVEAEKQVSAATKGSNVFAVLPIPLDRRKTAAVLEGAIADAVARKGAVSAAPAAPPRSSSSSLSVEPFHAPGSDSTPPSGSDSAPKTKLILLMGVGVAVAAVAAGGYFFLGKSKESAPTAAAAPKAAVQQAAAPATNAAQSAEDANVAPAPVVETSLVRGKVDDLLEKARLAMKERRYSEPVGDNALLYYRSAAAADPANGEAADGLQRVAGVLASRFDESMNAGKFDEASLALANLKAAAPNDARIPTLEVRLITAQVSKALADGNLDRAAALIRQTQPGSVSADQIAKWRAEIGRRQEDQKVQRVAGLITDRIRDGRLLDPADDSAKLYMDQLHDFAPANATTQRLARDLNSAYLRKARDAALANRGSEEDRWLNEAKADGASANEITAFQRDIASARQKAVSAESDRVVQVVRDRIRDGRLTDPAQDSAAFYLTQLQASDGTNANIALLSHDLAAKLLDRARAGRTGPQVDSDLAQAKRWGADPKDIAAVQQAELVAKTPSDLSLRSAAAAGVSPASLGASLKRTRYIAPDFPAKALAQHVSGSVTVEYTVDVNGDTRDVRVIEANPPGVFEHSAITAIKRWHYDPVIANGQAVEVPIRTSIRFELPK